MRAREFVREDADAQQVLDYIHGTHHEPLTKQLQQAVLSYPRWELRSVPLNSLHIPDQEYDDEEQEPEADPYNRVQAIDPDHAGEYSANFVDRRPIVVDADGWIIDGNHRAWAAAELLNRTDIMAWVPAKKLAEGKVKLYTDPDYFGAEVDDTGFDSLPVVNISADRLVGFEPDSKMNQPKSQANVEKIVAGLKKGDNLPPLLVRKYKNGYQVLDGHHRFWAYKLSGTKSIPVQIVADKDIEEISKQDVAENFADGKNPQDKGDSKRHGINTKASVSSLRKTAKQGGRKGQLAHWLANMKSGRAKAKRK